MRAVKRVCVCVSVYIYEILKYMNNDVENNFFRFSTVKWLHICQVKWTSL